MKYFALAMTIAAATAGKVGDVFIGCYTDPNHPDGYRWVSFTSTIDKTGARIGECAGSDTGKVQEWDLPATAMQTDMADQIIIDFSSKGGPSDLAGVWDAAADGITWSDGNTWPKTNPAWCPQNSVDLFLN